MSPKTLSKQVQKARKRRYLFIFKRVSQILFDQDPIQINLGGNTDEYDPEAQTILKSLGQCKSEEDVAQIVHAAFVQWFGVNLAGPKERYQAIAQIIWAENLTNFTPEQS